MNKKLSVFPGVSFNYTQPAEDAVDEAETGLKSALAVKVFGPDLQVLEAKGRAIERVLHGVRGIEPDHGRGGAGPAQSHGQIDRDQDRALRNQRGRRERTDRGRGRRRRGDIRWCRARSPSTWSCGCEPQFRETPEQIGNDPGRRARRAADPAPRARRHSA